MKGGEMRPYMRGYHLEIVLCVDATVASETSEERNKKFLEHLKQESDKFCGLLQEKMGQRFGRDLESLRIRLIAFRDYLANGKTAIQVTDFFEIPEQEDLFVRCVQSIQGCGNTSQVNGMEAIAYAIRSKWKALPRSRQIIILLTDAECYPIGAGASSPYYPKGMAENMEQLTDWWEDLDLRGKRLILYAPDTLEWQAVFTQWDLVYYSPVVYGDEVSGVCMQDIIDVIVDGINPC